MRSFTQLKRLLLASLFLLSGLLASDQAKAIRVYYASLSWKIVTPPPGESLAPGKVAVEFLVAQAGEWTFAGSPAIGTTDPGGTLYFDKDNLSLNTPITLTITQINTTENWYYAEFRHVYVYDVSTVAGLKDYEAFFENISKSNTLVNNPNATLRIKTKLPFLSFPSNFESPIASVAPIVFMGTPGSSLDNVYDLNATDGDGSGPIPSYAITPNGTFGAPSNQPAGGILSIDAFGLLTMNTTGLLAGTRYNTNITITDDKGASIMVDFILEIRSCPPEGQTAPSFVYGSGKTPANLSTISAIQGTPVSFNVVGTDASPDGKLVQLSASGTPIGAGYSPSLILQQFVQQGGTPTDDEISSTFNWTPGDDAFGNYQLVFILDDGCQQSTSVVDIDVKRRPFEPKLLGLPTLVCVPTGQEYSGSFQASDPDIDDKITVKALEPLPSGFVTTPSLPFTSSNNVANIDYLWATSNDNWGPNLIKIEVSDGVTSPRVAQQTVIVNDPPSFVGFAPPNGGVGIPYSYSFDAADLNLPAGDVLTVTSSNLPDGLNLTKQDDNTWLISGTPTSSGPATFNLLLTDSYPDCGTATVEGNINFAPPPPPPPPDCEECSFSQGKFFNAGGANAWPDVNGQAFGNVTIGGINYSEAQARSFASTNKNCSQGDKGLFIFRHAATLKLSKTCLTIVVRDGKTIGDLLSTIDAFFASIKDNNNNTINLHTYDQRSDKVVCDLNFKNRTGYQGALTAAEWLNAWLEANHCDDDEPTCTLKVGHICIAKLVETRCDSRGVYNLYDGYRLSWNKFSASVSGGSGNYTYSWKPAEIFVDATVANPVVKSGVSGNYTVKVTVTDTRSNCSVTSSGIAICIRNVRCVSPTADANSQRAQRTSNTQQTNCTYEPGVWVCTREYRVIWQRIRGCMWPVKTLVKVNRCVLPSQVEDYLCKGACLGRCSDAVETIYNNKQCGTARQSSVKADLNALEQHGTPTVSVYPNPANGNANVILQGFTPGKADMRILNMNGASVQSRSLELKQGINTIPVNLTKQAKGMYLIQVINTNGVTTTRLLVQ